MTRTGRRWLAAGLLFAAAVVLFKPLSVEGMPCGPVGYVPLMAHIVDSAAAHSDSLDADVAVGLAGACRNTAVPWLLFAALFAIPGLVILGLDARHWRPPARSLAMLEMLGFHVDDHPAAGPAPVRPAGRPTSPPPSERPSWPTCPPPSERWAQPSPHSTR